MHWLSQTSKKSSSSHWLSKKKFHKNCVKIFRASWNICDYKTPDVQHFGNNGVARVDYFAINKSYSKRSRTRRHLLTNCRTKNNTRYAGNPRCLRGYRFHNDRISSIIIITRLDWSGENDGSLFYRFARFRWALSDYLELGCNYLIGSRVAII